MATTDPDNNSNAGVTTNNAATTMKKESIDNSNFIYTVYNNMPFSKEIRFYTKQKYIDRDIVFQIQTPGVVIPTPLTGTNSFYITIGGVTYN